MQYSNEDVFMYQIMDILVSEHDYKIVNVPGSRRDVWLANGAHGLFPMIRLTPSPSNTALLEQDYLTKIKRALSSLVKSDRPILIINTHQDSESYVEEGVTQVILIPDFTSDESLFKTFPTLQAGVHMVDDNQNECAMLMAHMEQQQMKKAKEATRFKWKNTPKLSLCIVVVCALAFAFINFVVNKDPSKIIATLVASGGYYKAMVIYGQEYWRLISSIFVHYDIFTLLFYGVSLYQLGSIMEPISSKTKYGLTFLLSAIIGNVVVLIFSGNTVSFGMGGGLFGVLASFVLYAWENKLYVNPITRMRVSQIMMITLLALFLSGSSPLALAGGFVSGLFLSVMFNRSEKYKPFQKHFYLCAGMCVVFLGYGLVSTTTSFPQYKEMDKAVVKEYKRMGLKDYSKRVDTYLSEAYEEK